MSQTSLAHHRRLFGKTPLPTVVAPCAHLGDVVNRPGQVRKWRQCNHPDAPKGNPVCPCKGCGPKCPGYVPGDVDD